MRAREWRRKDVLALVTFLVFGFLYFNIHALHSNSAKTLEDVYQRGTQGGQNRRPAKTAPPEKDIDPFDPHSPANETLGVCAQDVMSDLCHTNLTTSSAP